MYGWGKFKVIAAYLYHKSRSDSITQREAGAPIPYAEAQTAYRKTLGCASFVGLWQKDKGLWSPRNTES